MKRRIFLSKPPSKTSEKCVRISNPLHSCRGSDATRCAFTIFELIAVIGVLSLLIGLLLPSLSSVRATSRSTLCKSNLRQMGIALQQYSMLHESFPMAVEYKYSPTTGLQTIAWDWIQSNAGVEPGPLWAFTDDPDRVMQCPDFHSDSTFGDDPWTGYNYNTSYLGAEQQYGGPAVRPGVRPGACRRHDTCAAFGDGGWRNGANKFMRAPENREHLPLGTLYSGGQAFRHRGACNICFLDGHVGEFTEPKQGRYANAAVLEQFMHFPKNGFLSDTDAAYDPR